MTDETPAIDPDVPPSGDGCAECLAAGGWWLHLRRCAQCGHVGCCDSSPERHASRHAREEGHPIAQSFEPGEDWFWDYAAGLSVRGSAARRARQPPGGAGLARRRRTACRSDWRSLLHPLDPS